MTTAEIAVILPMFNEAENVGPLLDRLAAVRERTGLRLWALAIDDGSQDGTAAQLIEAAKRHSFLRPIHLPRNSGMAAALRTGIGAALASAQPAFTILAFMDADLTHNPDDLPRLIQPILVGRADLVLGSRFVPGGRMEHVPWIRRAISVFGNGLGRLALRVPAADLTSGYRAMIASVFRTITLEEAGFGIQLEETVKAARAGFRIAEVPVTLGVRRHGYSKMVYDRRFWLGYGRLFLRLVFQPVTRTPPKSNQQP